MRKKVLLFVMTSVLMSISIPLIAQESDETAHPITNNHPVEPVFAHIVDTVQLQDYEATPYRIQDGQSYEEMISKLPGVEIHDDGRITVNGKNVELILLNGPDFSNVDSTVVQQMLKKVNQYENSKKNQRKAKRAGRKAARKNK